MNHGLAVQTVSALKGALPNICDTPPSLGQVEFHNFISFLVRADFRLPEFHPALWPSEEMTFVSMPKTAVRKQNGTMAREDKIWGARQVATVELKTKTELVQAAAQNEFGLRILAPDAGHHPTADCRRDYISHRRP